MMKYLSLLFAGLLAIASGWGVDLTVWIGMKEGLIAFLGLMAAAVFQVIPVTANFLGADDLTPHEAELFTKALDRQQKFWVGILAVTVITLIFVVLATVLVDKTTVELPRLGVIELSPALSGAIGGAFAFLLSRMTALMRGVLSLQRLRSALVVAAAKRRAAERAEKIQASIAPPPDLVPEGYGRIERRPQ